MIIYGGRKYLYDKLFVSLFFFLISLTKYLKKKGKGKKEYRWRNN